MSPVITVCACRTDRTDGAQKAPAQRFVAVRVLPLMKRLRKKPQAQLFGSGAFPASMARNSASVRTGTPRACALVSLDPAAVPATTYAVFFGDRATGLAAIFDDQGFGFIAGERFQRTGHHEGLSGEKIALWFALPLHIHPGICQTMDQVGGAVLCKEFRHALGHHTAETVDLSNLLCRRLPDGLQRAEMLRQKSGRLISDVPDAETEEQLVQIVLLGIFNGIQEIACTLFLELFQCQKLFQSQIIDVCRRVDKALFHQLRCHSGAETINIHGVPGCKMDDVAQGLCRAFRVDAAQRCFIFQMYHRGPAGWAEFRHLIGLCIFLMMRYADDFRNDIPGLPHLNGVPDAQTQLVDEILIVKGRPRHSGAREEYRIKTRRRRQDTGTAHSNFNAAQGRFLDFRRIFEGNRPARKFVGGTHQIPLSKIVDLDDRAVHIKVQTGTVLTDLFDLRNGILNVVDDVVPRRHRQAQTLQIIQTLGMGRQLLPADLLHIEHKDGKAAASGDLCVFLPQGPCCRIPRVLEGRCPWISCSAQRCRNASWGIYTSPRTSRNSGAFFRVLGIFLMARTLAVTSSPTTPSPRVDARTRTPFSYSKLQERPSILISTTYSGSMPASRTLRSKSRSSSYEKSIQKALHLDRMGHLRQLAAGRPTHLLGRGAGRDQLRKFCLQCLQFPRQGIVFIILQLRGILIVIKPVVLFNYCAKLFHALPGLFQFHVTPLSFAMGIIPYFSPETQWQIHCSDYTFCTISFCCSSQIG